MKKGQWSLKPEGLLTAVMAGCRFGHIHIYCGGFVSITTNERVPPSWNFIYLAVFLLSFLPAVFLPGSVVDKIHELGYFLSVSILAAILMFPLFVIYVVFFSRIFA